MKNSRNIINSLIGIFISVACIFFTLKNFELSQFIEDVKNINFNLFIIASLTLIFSVVLRSLRWSLFFKEEERKQIRVFELFKNEMIGYFGNNVLPLRLGDILRVSNITKTTQLSSSYLLGTIVAERIIDILSLFIFFLFFLIFSWNDSALFLRFSELPVIDLDSIYIYLSIFVLLIIVGYFLIKNNKFINLKLFISAFSNIRGYKKIFKITFLSLLIWTIYLINIMLISYSMPGIDNFSIIDAMSLLVVVTLVIVIVPSAPGSIGTFHFAVVTVMTLFNREGSDVESFSIILHAYSYITYSIIGGYFFIKSNAGLDN